MAEKILIAVTDGDDRQRISALLEPRGYKVTVADSPEACMSILDVDDFDVVVLDLPDLPEADAEDNDDGEARGDFDSDEDADDPVELILRRRPSQDMLLIAPIERRNDAVAAMKRAGGVRYVLRPLFGEDFLQQLERLVERRFLYRQQSRLLEESLEHIKVQSLYLKCLGLATITRVEDLGEAVVKTAMQETGAREGAFWVAGHERTPILHLSHHQGPATVGSRPRSFSLGLEEQSAAAGGVMRPGQAPRALAQLLPWVPARGLIVPLAHGDQVIGLLELGEKAGGGSYGERELGLLRTLSEVAARALHNAQHLTEASSPVSGVTDARDTVSGMVSMDWFLQSADREIYRARRYGRQLSFVAIKSDEMAQLAEEVGPDEYERIKKALVDAITASTRTSDILGQAADGEYYLLLPETDYFGCLMCMRRVTAGFMTDPLLAEASEQQRLLLSMGAATYPRDGEDLEMLVDACTKRIGDERSSVYRRLNLHTLDFWTSVERLIPAEARAEADIELPGIDEGPADTVRLSSPFAESLETFELLVDEVAREVARDPYVRGALYVGTPELEGGSLLLGGGDLFESAATRAFLLRPGADESVPTVLDEEAPQGWLSELSVPQGDGEPDPGDYRYMIYLTERSGFAMLGRVVGGDTLVGVQTSEATLVENLVNKLQERYEMRQS